MTQVPLPGFEKLEARLNALEENLKTTPANLASLCGHWVETEFRTGPTMVVFVPHELPTPWQRQQGEVFIAQDPLE